MIKNYFIIAWRNLAKNKIFSFINILGLTIGITVCLLIYLFILNEFSFDQFHAQKKNIYRVMRGFEAGKEKAPYLSGPYAPALLNDFPEEITKAIRVFPNNGLISVGGSGSVSAPGGAATRAFNEKKIVLADAGFFSFFSFPLVKGNPATVLNDPGNAVLTESTAKKYFGSEDPMGKIIQLDKSRQFKVAGIAKDIPSNSHLDFDLVLPLAIYANEDWFKAWIDNNFFTYVKLDEHVNKARLEQRFPAFIDKYMGKELARYGIHFDLVLTPLTEIYFEDASEFDNVRHGDKKVVYIFLSIAVLILLIACINFMNLSTIRAVERSKEVGLRKVMGALRPHLISQFIGESILLTLISCLLSLSLLQLLMPFYNNILGYTLTVSWNKAPIYLFLLGVILVVGFLAGSYPALVLSAFSPIQALKGKLQLGKSGSLFRQSLVVVQFSISVFLIIGTIIIMNQLSYVRNKQLGYDQQQAVVVPIDNNDIYNHRYTFKNELQSNPTIASVSIMSGEPGGGFFDRQSFEIEGQPAIRTFRSEFTDFEYVKTLGLTIIAGRDFSALYATDTTGAALINRTAATKLGFTPEQAIGKWIRNTVRDQSRRRIVGVVEDFNFLSLKEKMDGLVIAPNEDRRVAVIKLKTGNIPTALAAIKAAYAQAAPVYPLQYGFLDQKFDELYKKDIRQQTILAIFSGLAIFIACLGLFGLASFTATKRLKEIGVRKVLGSSTQGIVLLLSKDLLKPVLVATAIAIPVGYTVMNHWLENFAYHEPLHWWVFALAAALTIAIALVTVSIKAIRAALANPVKSLKAE
ncbi:MAG TPA: ABC transporter permease [Puia sp.]|nr:ABC transporter permease [Puia sp.]